MFPELVEGKIIKINKKFGVQGHSLGKEKNILIF